jgi:hypothetical protein
MATRKSTRAQSGTPQTPDSRSTVDIRDRLTSIAAAAGVISDALNFNGEDDAALSTMESIVLPLRRLIEELERAA